MKKIWCVLCVCMIMLFVPVLTASASGNKITLECIADKDNVAPGEIVTITCRLSGYENSTDKLTTLQLYIPMDTAVYTYVENSAKDMAGAKESMQVYLLTYSSAKNQLQLQFSDLEAPLNKNTGDLLSFQIKIKDTAEAGKQVSVAPSVFKCSDGTKSQTFMFETESKGVTFGITSGTDNAVTDNASGSEQQNAEQENASEEGIKGKIHYGTEETIPRINGEIITNNNSTETQSGQATEGEATQDKTDSGTEQQNDGQNADNQKQNADNKRQNMENTDTADDEEAKDNGQETQKTSDKSTKDTRKKTTGKVTGIIWLVFVVIILVAGTIFFVKKYKTSKTESENIYK